ncbi:hypothetical protein GGF32_007454 [Allomyces javanicus]|nr:hypothetical protein GGF32_007454 [Allomyces javanicus]
MTDPIPTSIFRQRIMTLVVGTCSIGDLAITIIIFRLVLCIRTQVLVPVSNEQSAPPSGRNSLMPLPHTTASKAELIQWVYTVDLVNLRRSSTTGNASGPSQGPKQHRGSRGYS